MPSTYISLTNKLLRRVNDVEIKESDFVACKGIQATAKDAIADTIREIQAAKLDWPFNAVEHTQPLVVGIEEYAWPLQFSSADWDSFQIQKDDTLNINNKVLIPIDRNQWYARLRDMDYDSSNIGRGIPIFCFPSHGNGFGISPSPNEAYTLKYRYYKVPEALINPLDETTIPSRFDYVIIAGALYYLNLFKENPDGVQLMKVKYEEGVRDMLNAFLPNPRYVYDGRVNFGGGTDYTSGGFFWYKG